jgi:hypothetical protein
MTTVAVIDARFKPAHRTRDEVSEAVEPFLAELRGYRATYLAVVEKARSTPSATLDIGVVIRALDKFDALEEELLEAQTDEARRNIVERAEEVEQGRAYLQPEAELVVEANTLVADMTDWEFRRTCSPRSRPTWSRSSRTRTAPSISNVRR